MNGRPPPLHISANTAALTGSHRLGSYAEGDMLVPDADEQVALMEAHRMDREGASFRKIGARLASLGIMPHRSKILACGFRSSNSPFADRDGGEPVMKYDTPRITAAMCRNPRRMPSRQAVYERFRSVIAKAVSEYSEDELKMRAEAWTDAAIRRGAVIVESP